MDSRVAIYVAILTWCQKWGSRLPFDILLLLNCACNMSTSNMSKFQSGRRQNYRQLPFYIVLMGTLKVSGRMPTL